MSVPRYSLSSEGGGDSLLALKTKNGIIVGSLIVALAATMVAFTPTVQASTSVDRMGGNSAVEFSTKISQAAFPAGAENVYLARQDLAADALSGSVVKNGPILLSTSNGQPPRTLLDEINRLRPKNIFILGGEGAISSQTAQLISTFTGGIPQHRIAGADRVQTSVAISRTLFPNGSPHVYLADATGANGNGSPDSANGGMLTDGPILLVNRNGVGTNYVSAEIARLGASRVTVLGGSGAVPDNIATAASNGRGFDRIWGTDRYGTSKAINSMTNTNRSHVFLVSGESLAVAAAASGKLNAPVQLIPNSPTNQNVLNYSRGTYGETRYTLVGNQGDLSDQVLLAIQKNQLQPVVQPNLNQNVGQTQGFLNLSQPPSPYAHECEKWLLYYANKVRAENGVAPVTRVEKIDDIARAWSQRIATTGEFKHSSQSDLDYGVWLYKYGFTDSAEYGEILAGNYELEPQAYAEAVINQYLGSPGHRAILLKPIYHKVGIGVAMGRDWNFTTMTFA